ncbi:Rieske (2Fe-2S) protein [Sphingobium sp. Cam5-1]|uniref:Rieske (2Fe-2S) protein n=1 Tax=Sphingobium sp. Cam5-1 TaxID=2789327 RepID=UPI0018AD1864|nr:Rieske 2Fe-2S domain-containing protein [Sphingobium sp. Cam5-1]QPI74908.1 Rieske 2Fe-2S domain-containing protein [Sphingobium sp. Cam5-1]
MSADFLPVAAAADLPNNSSKPITVNGLDLLLCHADGEFFCVQNECTHRAFSLAAGRIRRCMVLCPEHGMPFDLRTGNPKGQLTDKPLRTFETRVVDGQVEVAVPAEVS